MQRSFQKKKSEFPLLHNFVMRDDKQVHKLHIFTLNTWKKNFLISFQSFIKTKFFKKFNRIAENKNNIIFSENKTTFVIFLKTKDEFKKS